MTLIWDLAVWITVLFPMITGGIWIHQPGLKLELSQITVPVLLLTVIGLIWNKLSRGGAAQKITKTSSFRFAQWLWNLWARSLASGRGLWVGFAVVASLYALASLRRHWAYGSNAYDLGIFVNGLWNLIHHGHYFSAPRGGIELLTDHQSFIVWLIAPLFKAIPVPETLLVLQAVALASGGVACFFLCRQYLGIHWATAALPLLYWFNAPLRNANAFDFHPETLMLPLFLFGIFGVQSQRIRNQVLGVLSFLLAMLCKETAPAVAVGIGLAWILGAAPPLSRVRARALGWVAFAMGIFLFWFDLSVVPRMFGAEHFHLQAYSKVYGDSFFDVLLAPLLKPALFWGSLMNLARFKFLFMTLGPLAFVPLFGWRAFMAALPGFGMLFLTPADHKITTQFHYAIEPSVGIFWAFCLGLLTLKQKKWKSIYVRLGWIVLFCGLLFFNRSEFYRIRFHAPTEHHRWMSQVVRAVKDDVSFAASSGIVPHLATRAWIHEIPRLVDGDQKPVDCVWMDSGVGNWSIGSAQDPLYENIQKDLKVKLYELILECRSTKIYQRAGVSCLMEIPNC